LTGDSLTNVLVGGAGDDVLDGGGGRDTLIGGAGTDEFRFTTAISASGNLDTITDFRVFDGDKLVLDDTIFSALSGGVSAGNLATNTTGRAADSDDYLIFNSSTKTLFYDADGSGSGAAVAFAVLTGVNTLRYDDIVII
jgi:serralysin